VTPNLGALLSYLFVSPTTRIEHVLPSYVSESLDRQVFWMTKQVEDLGKLTNEDE